MNKYIHPLQQTHFPKNKAVKSQQKNKEPFAKILSQATEVKVSKHAKQRLLERNIHISEEKWQKISDKVNEAKDKGVTNSVVVTNEATLLVSAKNNTVVTAMNRDEATSKIFTNINGTILLNE